MSLSSNNDSTNSAVDISGTLTASVLKIPIIENGWVIGGKLDKYFKKGSLIYNNNNPAIQDGSGNQIDGLVIYNGSFWER